MILIGLIVFGPVILVSFFFAVNKKSTQAFKDFRSKHTNFFTFNILSFAVLGIFIGFLTDLVDFSDFASGDIQSVYRQKQTFITDLYEIYELNDSERESINNRFNEIFNQILPMDYSKNSYSAPIILSIILCIYASLTILSNKSEKLIVSDLNKTISDKDNRIKTLIDDIKQSNIEKNNLSTAYDYISEVLTQLKSYKSGKIERLETNISGRKELSIIDCVVCKNIFDPKQQIDIITRCLLSFFTKTDHTIKDTYLRIGLFIPDTDEEFMEIISSIDTHNKSDVIKSPNGKHKERFKISEVNPDSLVVEAYYSTDPIIINDCSKLQTFEYFDKDQKKRIKSIVAIPLSINSRNIGVLVIDCAKKNYFDENIDYKLMFEILAEQIPFWIYHEVLLHKFLSSF